MSFPADTFSVIPVPPARSRPYGWTVYLGRAVIGWVRRAEDCAPEYERAPGTFWAIPREGLGDPRDYPSPTEAAVAIREGVTP